MVYMVYTYMVFEEVYEEGHVCMIFLSAPHSALGIDTRNIHDVHAQMPPGLNCLLICIL